MYIQLDDVPKYNDGFELKKDDFDVHIIHNESRGGKDRTKMKHKHKTMLIDKGNILPPLLLFDVKYETYLYTRLLKNEI